MFRFFTRKATYLFLSSAMFIAGCGGGGESGNSVEPEATVPDRAVVTAAVTTSGQPQVVSLTKLSETRVSRTVYEYKFSATVSGSSADLSDVRFQIAGVGAGTSVVDGLTVLPTLAAGATVTAGDTVTLQHDRSFAFDTGSIRWVNYTGSSGQTCYRVDTQAAVDCASPGAVAVAGSGKVVVSASATLAGGVGALMVLRVDGQILGSTYVNNVGAAKDYVFYSAAAIASGAKVDIVFVNDAAITNAAGIKEDRNLFVDSVTVDGGTPMKPTDPGVVIDQGSGATAFDGVSTMPGQRGVWWNGALRFPSRSTPAVVGRIIDGYLDGALVFWDCDGDWKPTAASTAPSTTLAEPVAISHDGGRYELGPAPAPKCVVRANIPVGARDVTLNTTVLSGFSMSSVAGSPSLITPLTTLVSVGVVGQGELQAHFGWTDPELLTDYYASATPDAIAKANVAAVIASMLPNASQFSSAQLTTQLAGISGRILAIPPTVINVARLSPGEIAKIAAATRGFDRPGVPFEPETYILHPGRSLNAAQLAYLDGYLRPLINSRGLGAGSGIRWAQLSERERDLIFGDLAILFGAGDFNTARLEYKSTLNAAVKAAIDRQNVLLSLGQANDVLAAFNEGALGVTVGVGKILYAVPASAYGSARTYRGYLRRWGKVKTAALQARLAKLANVDLAQWGLECSSAALKSADMAQALLTTDITTLNRDVEVELENTVAALATCATRIFEEQPVLKVFLNISIELARAAVTDDKSLCTFAQVANEVTQIMPPTPNAAATILDGATGIFASICKGATKIIEINDKAAVTIVEKWSAAGLELDRRATELLAVRDEAAIAAILADYLVVREDLAEAQILAAIGTSQPAVGAPVAFTVSQASGEVPLAIVRWDFGDGGGIVELPVSGTFAHTYANAGSYTVSVSGLDVHGRPALATQVSFSVSPATSGFLLIAGDWYSKCQNDGPGRSILSVVNFSIPTGASSGEFSGGTGYHSNENCAGNPFLSFPADRLGIVLHESLYDSGHPIFKVTTLYQGRIELSKQTYKLIEDTLYCASIRTEGNTSLDFPPLSSLQPCYKRNFW